VLRLNRVHRGSRLCPVLGTSQRRDWPSLIGERVKVSGKPSRFGDIARFPMCMSEIGSKAQSSDDGSRER
jgi:hypothetical protein